MDILLFIITSKKIKYLGIHLIKEVKDLYNGNFKFMKKEIEKDIKNGNTFHIRGPLEQIL